MKIVINGKINKWSCFRYAYCFVFSLVLSGCSGATTATVKKNETETKVQTTITEQDYAEETLVKDDIEVATEEVCLMFGRAQLLVLSTDKNTCVKISNNLGTNLVTIYELIDRNPTQPKLGAKLGEYTLPATTEFNTIERYFYYDYARKIDFDEPDVRLRLVEKELKADIIIQKKDGSGRKGLIDLVKNSSHMQLHYLEGK